MTKQFGRKHCAHFLPALLLAAILLFLSGCMMVGPDYQPVEPVAPDEWNTDLQGGLTPGEMDAATLAHWWSVLDDPTLSSLEERAVQGNLGLKDAEARVREARAMRGVSRAGLFPTVDATAAASKTQSSENSGTGQQRELYVAGFDAGWELDVFGGVRRSIEAAQANLEATQENLHDVLVSLMAEVALNYIELRTYQTRLSTTESNIKALQESYDINLSRQQAGLISELSVQESLRILESARAVIPTLEAGLEAAKNRLAILLGESPGSLHQELAE